MQVPYPFVVFLTYLLLYNVAGYNTKKLRLASSLVGAATSESLGVFLYMTGIYKITSPSGKSYIGQSKNIKSRWKSHQSESSWFQCKLYNSFKSHGVEAHTFEVVEECPWEELNNRERHHQEQYNTIEEGLNHYYQQTDTLPKIVSEETKRKTSNSLKGRVRTEEHSRKIIKANKGKKRTQEQVHTMNEQHRERKRKKAEWEALSGIEKKAWLDNLFSNT